VIGTQAVDGDEDDVRLLSMEMRMTFGFSEGPQPAAKSEIVAVTANCRRVFFIVRTVLDGPVI